MMPPDAPPVESLPRAEYRWYHKIGAFLFISLCMLVGLFLLIFPWTYWWGGNYFSDLLPQMEQWWDNVYVRGAVSGLGLVNLYISIVELFRLDRFVR
ncbi:MAG TPA: hypothetical protein VKE70_02550 [Candidatus Solibacter sp.]|nr:hypothetical protein [Candidatus Solibacter sp.]